MCARGPQGWDAPEEDRAAVDRAAGEGASAYGELPAESAARLLRWLAPGPADVLYDLGSGTGKLVLQAACTTVVGRAVGIELSAFRHEAALAARAALLAELAPPEAAQLATRLHFVRGDLRRCELGDATIVYAGSTCFPDALLSELAERAARAPRLRALLSSRPLPSPAPARLAELGRVRLPMSWSRDERVWIYGAARQGAEVTR